MDVRTWLAQPVAAAAARRWVLGAGMGAFALVALLYLARPDWYFAALPAFFFFDHPFRYPFHDTGGVMATVECWRAGIDVYVRNPCDAENRAWPYSPLMLRLWFLPTASALLPLVGGLLGLCFLLSQALLPQAGRRRELLLVLAALLSPSVVFAIERANIDLLIFILLVGAARALLSPPPLRALAYALIVACGLLKFYPFVAMAVVMRERAKGLLLVLGLSALACAWFLWQYHVEIAKALLVVRSMDGHWGPFTDRFGARQFVAGLWTLLAEPGYKDLTHLSRQSARAGPGVLVLAAALVSLITALRLAGQEVLVRRLRDLPARQLDVLVIGALIFSGCFFAGYSNAYRAIFLLMLLPGLMSLSREHGAGERRAPAWLRWAPLGVVYSMWAPGTQHLIQVAGKFLELGQAGGGVLLLDWLLHECVWWWLATVCVAVLLRCARDAPLLRAFRP